MNRDETLPSGNGHFFEVRTSQQLLGALEHIKQQELQKGEGKRFLNALRSLYDRLRRDPHAFGEALYRLAGLRLTVYSGLSGPLAVQYAIHDEKPLVFIKSVQWLAE